MNPYLARREPLDLAAIEATWRKTQASIDAYWDCPFADYRLRTWAGRVVR